MKTKTLALANGVIGLVGGIYLLLYIFFATSMTIASTSGFGSSIAIATGVKIATLILGIVALVYYKGDERVGVAGGVLFIIGGSVGLIPFLGWIGGILLIIGGALFLSSLKKF